MKKILLLIFYPISVLSQNTIGLPDVFNYTKQLYNAGLQNWRIKQDKNGILYVANNEGLLTYDGKSWNLHALPNKSIVRSVEIGTDNRVYVGGQDEAGYFSPDKNGLLKYHSIIQLIPLKDKSFGDVWDIVSLDKNVFFRSPYKIFKLTNNVIEGFSANSEWSYLGLCHGKLYAHDYRTGLMTFSGNVWTPVETSNTLPKNDPVTAIVALQNDTAVISTLSHGLFVMANQHIASLKCANDKLFNNNRIYAATAINNNWIALATSNNGVYIINVKGNIIQSFSRTEGLQNNNVLSIFFDRQSNLWLGLDNGIDLILYNSAIKQINPGLQNASGYASIIFDSKLFVGTSNCLYSVPVQPLEDISFNKGNFTQVANTKGQVWNLSEINNQLLLGKHEGAFVVSGSAAKQITSIPGFWNFVPLSSTFPSLKIIAGNYKGFSILDYADKQFTSSAEIPGFYESSRYIVIDKNENIWISHPYHGIFKIYKDDKGNYINKIYTDKKGLPSSLNNQVFKIKNEVVVATDSGIFIYNEALDIFERSDYYKNLLGNQSIRYLKEDPAGNIWFIHEKNLGVIDFSDKDTSLIYFPELNNKLLSGFEFIYPYNENNIFLGSEKGIFQLNYDKYKRSMPEPYVQIRMVKISGKTDSILFGGYFKDINENQFQLKDNLPTLDNNWKTIHFEFSSSLFGYESNLKYSYALKGFDESWSEWGSKTEMEYTKLSPGKYIFKVKAKNNLGKESAVSAFEFNILPPWYNSVWASVCYFLIFVSALYIFREWQRNKFKGQQLKYEEEQKRLLYIHELELDKTASELVTLKNKNLETEVNFKNSELASSAMHLVKKSELFAKIKNELNRVIKEMQNPQSEAELKKLIKSLSEADNMDQEWDNFAKHFDKVHSDFLSILKEKHPGLSSNDLKLCAYLRMNLSTKEIARLMNISVRGVDISRYRLRKKLLLNTEESLFDYMLSIKIEPRV